MTSLPRVGTLIRVTLTYGSGTREIYEGTVTRTPDDGLGIVELGSGVRVALNDRLGRTVTVEELEPPKPTLPPEPPIGSIVRPTSGDLWRHKKGGWYALLTTEPKPDGWVAPLCGPLSWGDFIAKWGAPVPLVAVPDLAELVDALRDAAADVCPHGEDFDPAYCDAACRRLTALLDKHKAVQS